MNSTVTTSPVILTLAAAAALGCVTVLDWACSWVTGRYKITLTRRGLSARRRWYGTATQVIPRQASGDDDAPRFAVLDWWDDDTEVLWLWVIQLDPDYVAYWAKDARPFWARVTDFAPYSVRRIRPHWRRFGWLPLPWMTQWEPAPVYLDDLPAAQAEPAGERALAGGA